MLHQVRSSEDDATHRVDPFLMSVLKSLFEAIVREMTLVVMKASRSAVIKNAKDRSCAILTYDHRLVSTEEALPNYAPSMDKATRPITELSTTSSRATSSSTTAPTPAERITPT